MSTVRKAKWLKYFQDETETVVRSKLGNVSVFDIENIKIDTLNNNHSIIVPKMPNYSPLFKVEYKKNNKSYTGYIKEEFISKPIKIGSTENLGIRSETLINLGTDYELKNTPCKKFDNEKQLSNSILEGLKNNPNVNNYVYECVNTYFNSSDSMKFNFNNMDKFVINELGKYLGELLLGYIGFKGHYFNVNTFIIPLDGKFVGVDSFIINGSNTISISNKYGEGAAASFFPNILPKVLNTNINSNSILLELKEICNSSNITSEYLMNSKGGRQIVYDYGLKKILNLEFSDYLSFPNDIKNNIKNGNVDILVSKIEPIARDKIKSKLPHSITKFFSEGLTNRLNSCSNTGTQISDILYDNDYYQVRLNDNKWKQGLIDYSIINTKNCKVKFVNNMSPISDIHARYGTINYRIYNE